MCNTPSSNNGAIVAQQQQEAEQARQREAERQQRVDTGMASIRDAFQGYDDSYFGRFRDQFVQANQPALADQQEADTRNLFFNLARAGNLNGSAASDQRGRLARGFAMQRGQLLTAAEDAAQQQRQAVANTRSNLETQLRATEDADLAAAGATAQARAIERTPGMTTGAWAAPLVQAGVGAVGAYQSGENAGYYRALSDRLFPVGGRSNSAGVVR